MPQNAANQGDSVFRAARKEASLFNERLSSMEGVHEETGIDRTRVQRIETGVVIPYPDEVALLIDTYHKPELRTHYCGKLCPLGKGRVQVVDCVELDRTSMALASILREAGDLMNQVMDISADGKLDSTELDTIETEVLPVILQMEKDLLAYRIMAEKALKRKHSR